MYVVPPTLLWAVSFKEHLSSADPRSFFLGCCVPTVSVPSPQFNKSSLRIFYLSLSPVFPILLIRSFTSVNCYIISYLIKSSMPTPSLPLSFAQNYSRFMNSSTSCYFLTEGRQMAQEMNSHIFRMNKLQNCRLKTFNCTLNICLTFCRGRLTLSLCRSCRTSLMLRLPSPFLSASAKVCFSHVIIQRVKKSEA